MKNYLKVTMIAFVVAALAIGGCGGASDEVKTASDALVIQLGNNAWETLVGVEFSPASAETYQAVPLPDGKLDAGDFYEWTIVGGAEQCRYDLRFALEGGTVTERKDVDLCAASFYHFEPDPA